MLSNVAPLGAIILISPIVLPERIMLFLLLLLVVRVLAIPPLFIAGLTRPAGAGTTTDPLPASLCSCLRSSALHA